MATGGTAGGRTITFIPTILPGTPAAPTVLTGAPTTAGPGKSIMSLISTKIF